MSLNLSYFLRGCWYCTWDLTPESAKDTRFIVQREPSAAAFVPESTSTKSCVPLSDARCPSMAFSSSSGYLKNWILVTLMFTTHVHVCINYYAHYSYCSCSSFSIHVQKCNTRVGFCAPFVVSCLNPYLFSRACIKSLRFSFRFPISLFSVPNVFRALQYSSRSVLKKWWTFHYFVKRTR